MKTTGDTILEEVYELAKKMVEAKEIMEMLSRMGASEGVTLKFVAEDG